MPDFSNEEMIKRMLTIQESHEISRRALSIKLGMSANALSDWEKGLGRPSVAVLDRFSKLFRVPVDYLMYGDSGAKAVPDNAKERELLSVFRALPLDRRDMVLSYAIGVSASGKASGEQAD